MLSDRRPYLQIEKDELNFQHQLGKGAQGAVFKALWRTKQTVVAVKHVFEFDPELEVLQRLQHKHVVQFLGAVEEDHFKALVLEYAEHGSLYEFAKANPPAFEQLLIWSRHIALGLNYLHNGVSPKIIHRDLKSRNVVIATDRIAKICDFGSSRSLDHSVTRFSRLHGTMAWMAPEVMRNAVVSEKCDTYSFAILLWELITGKVPFEGEEDPQIMFGVCQYKRRPPIPNSCPEGFATLIRDCWDDSPEKRPTVENILRQLNGMLGDFTLNEQVDQFLASRQSWASEFEKQIQDLKEEYREMEGRFQGKLQEKDNEIQKIRNKMLATTRSNPLLHNVSYGAINGWTEEDVINWLNFDPDTDYSSIFRNNNITGAQLLKLSDLDLKQMGISSLGHRKDILRAIWDLGQKLNSIVNYPPLVSPKPADKTKTTGTKFTLSLTYGNNFIPPTSKWNLFLFVEGDKIAARSVKCVEFKIDTGDVVQRTRHPYVMEDFRYEKPTGEVEVKLLLRGNVNKPKVWSKRFEVVLSLGGFSDFCNLEVYLNEDQIPSAAASVTSSISSFSSLSNIDNWKTSPGAMGAWAAGPPQTLRSPVLASAAWSGPRRDSSPFSSSPSISPRLNKRKASGSGAKLNHSSSSPAKMNQLNHSKPRREAQSYISLQENTSARTPTHNPKDPRFSSIGNSFSSRPDFIFGSPPDSVELNANFASVTDQDKTLRSNSDIQHKLAELEIKNRGVSVSSTLIAFSEAAPPDTQPSEELSRESWWDRPAWGETTEKRDEVGRKEKLDEGGRKERLGDEGGRKERDDRKTSNESLELARTGRVSYADILNQANKKTPPKQQNTPPQNTPPLTQNTPPLTQNTPPLTQNTPPLTQNTRRYRKDSSGSNKSDKSRGGGTRGKSRGRRRGGYFNNKTNYN